MSAKILLIDADRSYRQTCKIVLEGFGHEVTAAESARKGMILAAEDAFDLIVMDLSFVDQPALDVLGFIKNKLDPQRFKEIQRLREFQAHFPEGDAESQNQDAPVITLTALRIEEIERQAIRLGASECLLKGGDNDELKSAIAKALESRKSLLEQRGETFISPFLGENPAFKKVLDFIDKIADSQSPVLITGESGVGKEIVARLIWQRSSRVKEPLGIFKCTGVTKEMIDDALFGHVKYAFTGAARDRKGLLRASDKGTLFLDEIGETSLEFQSKLLRAIQFGDVQTVGTDKTEKVDVRFLAATNRDIEKEIAAGNFRLDLFYRFTFTVEVPSLRDRAEDIPKMAAFLLEAVAKRNKRDAPALGEDALAALAEYHWPGNIRQLETVLEYGLVMSSGGSISKEDLPDYIFRKAQTSSVPKSIATAETEAIIEALQYVKGVRTKAASILGIATKTLRDKIDRYNLNHLFPVGAEAGQEEGGADETAEAPEAKKA